MLAFGAEMGTSAGKKKSANGSPAAEAGLPGSQVDTMLKLEKSPYPVRIDVIGDRGASKLNGVLQDLAQREPEAFQFGFRETSSASAGPDAGTIEALVRVNVADTGKQLLVQQSGLDGQASLAEEGGKRIPGDTQRFCARCGKGLVPCQVTKVQASETPGVDKAHLAAACESQTDVGVDCDRRVRRGDEQAASHAEVDDPLSFNRRLFLAGGGMRRTKFADNMFPGAMD